jgi:hypothetical protein
MEQSISALIQHICYREDGRYVNTCTPNLAKNRTLQYYFVPFGMLKKVSHLRSRYPDYCDFLGSAISLDNFDIEE